VLSLFFFADSQLQSVILSVRGTLSLQDCVTDASAKDQNFAIPGTDETCVVHGGMYDAARNIVDDMEIHMQFDNALRENPEYAPVITGHSLGAGTAAILALMLRHRYANLRCFAFSPPGGLMSHDIAVSSSAFITSMFVGKDWITRLSRASLRKLSDEMQRLLKNSDRNKVR
jgi:sn1-specific diacylglycerol lipase